MEPCCTSQKRGATHACLKKQQDKTIQQDKTRQVEALRTNCLVSLALFQLSLFQLFHTNKHTKNTLQQSNFTTTIKLHYNINHCYLWFAVSLCKHNAVQKHQRGEIFPPKMKKKRFPPRCLFSHFSPSTKEFVSFFFGQYNLVG